MLYEATCNQFPESYRNMRCTGYLHASLARRWPLRLEFGDTYNTFTVHGNEQEPDSLSRYTFLKVQLRSGKMTWEVESLSTSMGVP